MRAFDVKHKHVIVAGASRGLGRELALQLVARGAHITVLARDQDALDTTYRQLRHHAVSTEQTVATKSLDLLDVHAVTQYATSWSDDELPFALFCVAGGAEHELGFFADVSPDVLRICMDKNYLSSAYLAQAVWKRWTTVSTDNVEDRHLILTSSTAALISLPGYDAYSPTKAAIRSLADTLRQEALMYLPTTRINVHCSFPGTIYTESFYREQRRKPPLLKRLEGSEDNTGGQDAGTIARGILQGIERGDFFKTTDFNTRLLLNNMRGPSPHNSRFPLVDWCLGWIMSFVWPILRMYFDRVVRTEGAARVEVEPTKSEPHRGSV